MHPIRFRVALGVYQPWGSTSPVEYPLGSTSSLIHYNLSLTFSFEQHKHGHSAAVTQDPGNAPPPPLHGVSFLWLLRGSDSYM